MRPGGDTPRRLIEAAERLFIEGGEEATSLRAITRAAGVNVAAVHYHFGGRDELLRAVLDRKIAPLNAQRLRLLDQAVATHGDRVPVEALLAAFLRPDLELIAELRASGQVSFARFMGRAYTQPSATVAGFMDRQFQPVGDRLFALLERAVPDVDPAELRIRMRMVVALVTVLFATAPEPGETGPLGTDDLDEQLTRLVAFLAPGLATPPDGHGGDDLTPRHRHLRSGGTHVSA
jgi:AcrR family transcriptional regulator